MEVLNLVSWQLALMWQEKRKQKVGPYPLENVLINLAKWTLIVEQMEYQQLDGGHTRMMIALIPV